jgi:hypothetical protein
MQVAHTSNGVTLRHADVLLRFIAYLMTLSVAGTMFIMSNGMTVTEQ